jgi:hypothetical protein
VDRSTNLPWAHYRIAASQPDCENLLAQAAAEGQYRLKSIILNENFLKMAKRTCMDMYGHIKKGFTDSHGYMKK